MPTPFMCHWCDKPTMNIEGICIECEQKYEEGNKDIAATIRELETRVRWLEKGLKQIASKTLGLDDEIQAVLDGEPTTADEYNDVISQYEDHEIQSDIKKVQSEIKDSPSPENVVRISDINKEIAEEWNRDREEKIKKKANMIQSIGYRGEE